MITPGTLNQFSTNKIVKEEGIKQELNDEKQVEKFNIEMRNPADYVSQVGICSLI